MNKLQQAIKLLSEWVEEDENNRSILMISAEKYDGVRYNIGEGLFGNDYNLISGVMATLVRSTNKELEGKAGEIIIRSIDKLSDDRTKIKPEPIIEQYPDTKGGQYEA